MANSIVRHFESHHFRVGQAPRVTPSEFWYKASTAIRRSVPIRTFSDWDNPAPGFVEADLVSHSGPFAKGAFTQTLVLTDVATGWTECAPLLAREQTVLTTALSELRKLLPFPLLGFDTDNDSVFMNETVRDYCLRDGIKLTRCRPYRKNDQAFVEQKNGAIVRKMVGYRRFEGLKATNAGRFARCARTSAHEERGRSAGSDHACFWPLKGTSTAYKRGCTHNPRGSWSR